MPLFSVIVPLFNKEATIVRALRSILAQEETDFEIILVNDGSTDGSVAQAKKVDDPRIRFFETKNRGVSAARNLGAEKATGDVLAFLDADDTWEPHHLTVLKQLYHDFPGSVLLATSYSIFYREGHVVTPDFDNLPNGWCGVLDDFFATSLIYRVAWTSAVAVPKDAFLSSGGFNTAFAIGEDTDLWIRLALSGPVAFCNLPSATHRLDAQNRAGKRPIASIPHATFTGYEAEEQKRPSVKRFVDLYRIEFALKHRVAGRVDIAKQYLEAVDPAHIPWRTELLLALPIGVLKGLYAVKKFLEKNRMLVSAYR